MTTNKKPKDAYAYAMTFGGYLKSLRVSKGFGLREYAKILNTDSGNYSKYETNAISPPRNKKNILKLVKKMNLEELEIDRLCTLSFVHHVGVLCGGLK